MKNTIFLTLISLFLLSGCSIFDDQMHMPMPDPDVYSRVGDNDLLNDKPIVLENRVSHIVTFEYDSSELPFNAADVVEPHVRYLIANPKEKVALQGNASEEGTRTYNYELAQKRINSVKKLFLELGLDPHQIVELPVGETQAEFIPRRSVLLVY